MLEIFSKSVKQNLESIEKSNQEVIEELDNINERFNTLESTLEEIYEHIQIFSTDTDNNFCEHMEVVNNKLDYIIELLEERRQNEEEKYS